MALKYKIIVSLVFLAFTISWCWYVNNLEACAFARGIKATEGVFKSSHPGETAIIFVFRRGDYEACAYVGKSL